MATNKIFAEDTRVVFVHDVGSGVKSGDFVMLANDVPGVALADVGGSTRTDALGTTGISVTSLSAGVGNPVDQTAVATTGTWDLPVPGVTASGLTEGTLVYWDSTDSVLTTTKSTNKLVGSVNAPLGYAWRADVAPIRIGAPN